MAKKKAAKKRVKSGEARANRSGDVSAEILSGHVDDLNRIIGDLDALVGSLAEHDMQSVHVDGIQKIENAKTLAKQYIVNVRYKIEREALK